MASLEFSRPKSGLVQLSQDQEIMLQSTNAETPGMSQDVRIPTRTVSANDNYSKVRGDRAET